MTDHQAQHPQGDIPQTHDYFRQAWGQAAKFLDNPDNLRACEGRLSDLAKILVQQRADKMRAQIGTVSIDENLKQLETLFRQLTRAAGDDAHGQNDVVSFEHYQALCSQELAGIVLTAHPTFGFHEEARQAISTGLTTGKAGSFEQLRPLGSPTLAEERQQAEDAIHNLRAAHRLVMQAAFRIAQDVYPDEWTKFNPSFLTLASWVGFDLDGRTDINWSTSLDFRYHLAAEGLKALAADVQALRSQAATDQHILLDQLTQSLDQLTGFFIEGMSLLNEAEQKDDFSDLNCRAMMNKAEKEATIEAIDHALDALMAASGPDDQSNQQIQYGVLRSSWHSFGLGLCHIHFRLNAVQLHNAIRVKLGLTSAPDRSASRRHYLAAISQLLDTVEPVNIHYGTLNKEKTTARRVFMLAAQFEKHFDGRTPIRMLVAESDTPFTMLTALYYARLFAVDQHVEISPLFETALGLQRGDRVIDELLDNPHFDAYIRKQGRFCVQLGFSDSGRYIGQLAANLAVERFKLRLTRLWQKRGLGDVQLLFFDTHGESMGRGAHPDSLMDRFLFTHTPEVRRLLSGLDRPHKHEVSFQGGDGYLWFSSPETSLAVLTEFLKARLTPSGTEGSHDYLYRYSGWSLDFFLTLREYQEKMAASEGYVALIDSLGSHMLYPTGSRATKRQGPGSGGVALETISQIRAIPNNAILQQVGYMANSVAGLARAIALAPDRFGRIYDHSPRLKRLVSLAMRAMAFSSTHVLKGYEDLMTSDSWLSLAEEMTDPDQRTRMRRLSERMEGLFKSASMGQEIRHLRRDGELLHDLVVDGVLKCEGPDYKSAIWTELHQLRVSLVQFIYMKAMEIPQFSSRLDISLNDVLDDLLHLDIETSLTRLDRIFPPLIEQSDDAEYGEDQTFEDRMQGYSEEHEKIFAPIQQAYDLVLTISALLAQEIGAFG